MRRWFGGVLCVVLLAGLAPASGAASRAVGDDAPRVIVDVATGLLDGQVVHVRGSGLIPGEPVAFMNCLGTGACFRGWTGVTAVADSHGRVAGAVPVKRYRNDYFDELPGDCAYDLCTMRIVRPGSYEDGYADRAATRVSFARLPTSAPSSVITPSTPLPSVANIHIDASGFTPGLRVRYECIRTSCTGSDEWMYAGPLGTVAIDLTVTRRTRDSRDCADECAVTVYSNGGATTVPLHFDRSMPLVMPTVTVTPRLVRAETGMVTVDVAHADPAEHLTLTQCGGLDGSRRCSPGVPVVSDALGGMHTSIPVSRYLTQQFSGDPLYFAPLVDCAASSCTIWVTRDGWSGTPIATARVGFVPDAHLPILRIGSAVVREGGAADRVVRLPVTLDRPAAGAVSFGWTDGTFPTHSVVIPSGVSRTFIDVPVPGNDQDDPDRDVSIQLTTITGAQPELRSPSAHIRVIDDDPTPTLDVANTIVPEGAPGVFVPVHLSGPTGRRVEFTYRTISGSAQSGSDYVDRVAVVDYPFDELQIWVPIVDDAHPEPVEQFDVEIVAVRGARMGNSRAHVWIGDNDGPAR